MIFIISNAYQCPYTLRFFLPLGCGHRLRHGSTGAAVGIAVQPGVPGARGFHPFPSPTAGDLWKPGILMMIYGDLYVRLIWEYLFMIYIMSIYELYGV